MKSLSIDPGQNIPPIGDSPSTSLPGAGVGERGGEAPIQLKNQGLGDRGGESLCRKGEAVEDETPIDVRHAKETTPGNPMNKDKV
ncbi:hypothetical protein Aspvir_010028 [Aspergillus viridinutans]|uniref:Uncharacterized protein n=1 Tax=Aspergillus viridinutans TaxID=75553 RepID=A0A9P3C166_ASPVI|nr:uncharacterized protein Aspvir_010028 [Aspergillus viridinutans]GIK05914.1 hypothetical protein Aspvir_010028 [Aspergillus viridinutans]